MRFTVKKPVVVALVINGLMMPWECVNAAPATLRCTNPASGVVWDIKIDYQSSTANSFPAAITEKIIKWHDVLHGGHYEFDRASGDLTVIYASSTGGFTLKNKCYFVK